RDRTAIHRVVHHKVGVASQGDGSLTRKQPKELGGLCAGGVNESVKINLSPLHAVGVEEIHAVLDTRQSVGDLGEIAPTQFLLPLEVERRVVGGHGANRSTAKCVP